jgi:hypothetical protein
VSREGWAYIFEKMGAAWRKKWEHQDRIAWDINIRAI